jgi:LCP family protein required for cell wall assembly
VRTDTVIVASIDTDTGDTTLFSLPRNLENLPFPPDSPLAEVYPDGFEAGDESESLLNAVYRNGPAEHPDILGPSDNPGADFLKLGVGEALGLHIDYFVLVNLDGFSRLVDALGGITVNVNYYVPVGGEPSTGALPDDYIAPGPNQHMDGPTALAFARGRFGLTDYDRMARQRCTIDAIIQAADPVTLLEQYQELAATTKDIVSTDIPRSALDDFVDVGFLVKDAEVRSVVFDSTADRPGVPGLRPDAPGRAGRARPRVGGDPVGGPGEQRARRAGRRYGGVAAAGGGPHDRRRRCLRLRPGRRAGGAGPGRAAHEERLTRHPVLRSRRRKPANPAASSTRTAPARPTATAVVQASTGTSGVQANGERSFVHSGQSRGWATIAMTTT